MGSQEHFPISAKQQKNYGTSNRSQYMAGALHLAWGPQYSLFAEYSAWPLNQLPDSSTICVTTDISASGLSLQVIVQASSLIT